MPNKQGSAGPRRNKQGPLSCSPSASKGVARPRQACPLEARQAGMLAVNVQPALGLPAIGEQECSPSASTLPRGLPTVS